MLMVHMSWRHELQRHWKTKNFAKLLRENLYFFMKLVATTMETIGKTNNLHNFHDFWNYGLRALRVQKLRALRVQNIEIMEIMSFTNSFLNTKLVEKSWPGQLFPHFGPGNVARPTCPTFTTNF